MPGSLKYRRKKSSKGSKRLPSKGQVTRAARSRNPLKDMSVYAAGKYAWQGVRYLYGLVNSELYKYDQTLTATAVSTSGGTLHLTSIAQGDGDGNRTGNSVFVRSVNIRGVLKLNLASAELAQPIRLAVVIDTQQLSDTGVNVANVYEAVNTYSHLNSDVAGRYKILYSHVFVPSTATMAQMPFQINLPMQQHVRFNGTTGSDIQKGGIYFLYMSNVASASNPPSIDLEARVSYHDN